MFYDNQTVSINGNLAQINAFITKQNEKMAYVKIASQAGKHTNWYEFLAKGDKAQKVADVYREVKHAPKGHKKVNAFGGMYQDKKGGIHFVLLNIRHVSFGNKNTNKTDSKSESKEDAEALVE